MTNYRDETETRYYGSDLNKYIGEYCSKEMTVNNIDLIMYKRSKRNMRIIESKHSYESMPRSQREILWILAKYVKPLIEAVKILIPIITFNVYIVTGDYPYTQVEVTDVSNGAEYILENGQLKKWLEFECEIEEFA